MSEYDEPQAPPSRAGGCLVQAVTHAVALALGAVIGIVGASLLEKFENPELMSRPEGALSRAELIARLDASEKAYADLLAEKNQHEQSAKTEVEAANQKVGDLQTQVQKKQEEMAVLEAKVKKSAGKSAALKKELEAKQAELDSLQAQLTQALQEKAQLEADLQVSREETAQARSETEVARGETTVARNQTIDAKWAGFKSDAMVQICEKGNRNKLAKCRDAVTTALDAKRASQFKHCLSSGQASPRLIAFDKKRDDPELPRWSEWMDQESSFTENAWYIVFCDPTLPEAEIGSDDAGIQDLGE